MFLRVFIFYHLIFEVLSITKIISINGEVESGPVPTSVDSDTDCPTSCYFNSDCMLASLATSGQCFLYLFSALTTGLKIAKSTETTESIVYFKVTSSDDTCSPELNNTNLIFASENGYTYKWEYTKEGFSFPRCRDGWKQFDRSSGVSVCMTAVGLGNTNKVNAQSACQKLSGMLIGLETQVEAQWMWDQIKIQKGYEGGNYWLAGERINNPGASGCKTTDFLIKWSDDGMTKGVAITKNTNVSNLSCTDGK
ncbi:hypothetical protein GCK72_001059 [Caenorhabditis remanei]|uniref:PAN-3 domain-containing protein n=1 Tax=Caenorhabditis remanei TaxID=31234 RepID=A0A6A5HRJ7_CAERE|nr:hypothetical protein GCK72_001059 [Caenorhabditis remanei]KAF1769244.1 hypothetical protein GCK72_001059 [Caenorhabditis remanei]